MRSYPSHGVAARAYERVLDSFTACRTNGDSAYRFQLGDRFVVAVLSWRPTPEHLAAIAALPWGEGEPVIMPASSGQQLAQRSLQAAPQQPGKWSPQACGTHHREAQPSISTAPGSSSSHVPSSCLLTTSSHPTPARLM